MPVDYFPSRLGVRTVIRESRPEDIPQLIDGLVSLSYESRTARFFYDKCMLSHDELARLASPGEGHHLTRVAVISDGDCDGQIVGLARCVRVGATMPIADVGVVILDGWQRSGLGTQLVRELRDAALRIGITRWRADFFAINLGAEKLLGLVGREELRENLEAGIVRVMVRLVPDDAGAGRRSQPVVSNSRVD